MPEIGPGGLHALLQLIFTTTYNEDTIVPFFNSETHEVLRC